MARTVLAVVAFLIGAAVAALLARSTF